MTIPRKRRDRISGNEVIEKPDMETKRRCQWGNFYEWKTNKASGYFHLRCATSKSRRMKDKRKRSRDRKERKWDQEDRS
jgi:hypothetical protein